MLNKQNNKIKKNVLINPVKLETTPSIFVKKSNIDIKPRPENKITNNVGAVKHNPISTKEWFNSIYTYNNNSMKDLPSLDKSLSRIIRSYFNASLVPVYKYSKPQPKKRLKTRFKRLSLKNIFIGKAELKHTYDKVIITLYVFDGERNFLMKKFKEFKDIIMANYQQILFLKKQGKIAPVIPNHKLLKVKNVNTSKLWAINLSGTNFFKATSPEERKELLLSRKLIRKNRFNGNMLDYISTHFFKDKLLPSYFWNEKSKRINAFKEAGTNFLMLQTKNFKNILDLLEFTTLSISQLGSGHIIKKIYRIKKKINREARVYKDAVASLIVNYHKFNKFIFRLTPLISKLYGKKVEFNIIKLKTVFLDSSIFTQVISVKLKNRDNKLLKVMRSALSLIRLVRVNTIRERYGKDHQRSSWFNKVKNIFAEDIVNEENLHDVSPYLNTLPFKEISGNSDYELTKLVCTKLKYRRMAGVRLEARGRLTRRFTASRSVFKVRWKGGLKDPESRYKGITTPILRGHTTGNVVYSLVNSKTRNGAFGIKGWISGK